VTDGNKKISKHVQKADFRKDFSYSIENVYLVNDLGFNLFGISQLCDRGNRVRCDFFECVMSNLEIGEITLF